MNTVLRDADVLVAGGGDAIVLFFAVMAAQRFMQVVLVGRSEVFDNDVLPLSTETQRIFGAASLDEALRSFTEATT